MSEQDLFSDVGVPEHRSTTSAGQGDASSDRRGRVRNAALWAAYGDALGWISELTDPSGLSRRTRGRPLTEPMAWTRRIGGRSGVTVELPQGCYSDDTQLRLATSRAIRRDGFDVEAFAKVELPVWLSYGLGGGKSTSAAAQHLTQTRSTWWRNKFKGWTDSGGNGAAMRIQPHVWAARKPEQPESYLLDVVRNAICTHSHPTGLMGAVLHAQCVAYSLDSGTVPPPDKLGSMLSVAGRLPEMIDGDRELSFWRVAFEEEAGPFRDAWATSLRQAGRAVAIACGCGGARGEERYRTIIDGLELRDATQRGSGMLTSVAAMGLVWSEPHAGEAMRIAANTLGTDTDTIATMAGAILGATVDDSPPVDVLDADLIRCDAERLADIGCGREPTNHPYPDLMHWVAPKTRADVLSRSRNGSLVVRGLGSATQLENRDELANKGFRWRWLRLDFGQTLL
ncbi:MAG: ADP-ribosylglycohydrolase family protein, partial [Gammaproteobacteria bacterium]|nr:ADP-ribosylglycohydrolase family protein [Gammaproteobacteria bacterium]